jgi:hypothetical protein
MDKSTYQYEVIELRNYESLFPFMEKYGAVILGIEKYKRKLVTL